MFAGFLPSSRQQLKRVEHQLPQGGVSVAHGKVGFDGLADDVMGRGGAHPRGGAARDHEVPVTHPRVELPARPTQFLVKQFDQHARVRHR